MRSLCILLLLAAAPTPACGILDADEQRRREQEDVALQVDITASLAREADAIFIGLVAAVDSADNANVTVERVLKGTPEASLILPANDKNGVTVACWTSAIFRNSQVHASRRYIFYLSQGAVLRAGWVERRSGDLSLRSEVRAVRRAIGT